MFLDSFVIGNTRVRHPNRLIRSFDTPSPFFARPHVFVVVQLPQKTILISLVVFLPKWVVAIVGRICTPNSDGGRQNYPVD